MLYLYRLDFLQCLQCFAFEFVKFFDHCRQCQRDRLTSNLNFLRKVGSQIKSASHSFEFLIFLYISHQCPNKKMKLLLTISNFFKWDFHLDYCLVSFYRLTNLENSSSCTSIFLLELKIVESLKFLNDKTIITLQRES